VCALLYATLSFPKTHCGSCLGQLKRIGADVNSGLYKRLVVSPPGAEMGMVIVIVPHRKLFRCMVDHQSKLHSFSPLAQTLVGFIGAIRMTGGNRSILQTSRKLKEVSRGNCVSFLRCNARAGS